MKCVQCLREMEGEVLVSKIPGFGEKYLEYCKHPECPNYGLLQVGED